MSDYLNRISHYKGTPHEIGVQIGRAMGKRLEQNIHYYIEHFPGSIDMQKVHAHALLWMRRLPVRFQEELEGMAEGSKVPLQLLAEWSYVEEYENQECSGAVLLAGGHAWVARNNDSYVPEMWGYVTVREVEGRIPSISFSMEGDVFTPTGINAEKLWLHYNWLPAWDKPAPGKPHMPAFVFLTDALELCRSISDVEAMLSETDRDGGMMLFAVDGKTDEFALFDCSRSAHYRREPRGTWIAGTNHYCTIQDRTLTEQDEAPFGTVSRFRRMEQLVGALAAPGTVPHLPGGLIRALADPAIERNDSPLVTVYSNVACPSTGETWYTFGGYPAASKGNWQRLAWPWA